VNYAENPRVQRVSSSTGLDILTIVSIIMALVDVWKKCGLSEQAMQRRMRKPALFARLMIKNKVKEAVPTDKVDEVYEAILAEGKTITLGEVRKILHE
jgi:hypothetical protein